MVEGFAWQIAWIGDPTEAQITFCMPGKRNAAADKGKASTDQAELIVLEYLRKTNRPYSAIDISSNLNNLVSKAAAQKLLVKLAEDKVIETKTWGKLSVYYAKQMQTATVSAEDLAELDAGIEKLKSDIESLKKETRDLTTGLKQIQDTPQTSDLPGLLSQCEEETHSLQQKLDCITSGAAPLVSEEELQEAENSHKQMVKQWHSRKKLFQAMWAEVVEQVEKPKELEEKLGIEHDP